jgi:hypothetical protein
MTGSTLVLVILFPALLVLFIKSFSEPKYGIFTLVFVFPLDNLVLFSGVGLDKAIYMVILSSWSIHVLWRRREIVISGIGLLALLVGFSVYSILSVWFISIVPSTLQKINFTLFYISLPIIYIMYGNSFNSSDDLYTVGTIAGSSLIVFMTPGVVGYLSGVNMFRSSGQLILPYASTNMIGLYTISSLSLSLLRTMQIERSHLQQGFNSAILFVALGTLVLSGNRGAILGLGIILATLGIVSEYRRQFVMTGSLAGLLAGGIVYVSETVRTAGVAILTDLFTSGRSWLVLGMFRMLADRPLFGVGLGSFDLLITEYYPANLIKEHNPWYYENVVQAGIGQVPHGFYTAVGGELGLVGILLTGLLLTLSTRKAISLIRSSPTSQERRLSFFIFVGLVSTLFTAAFYGAGRDHIVWFYIFLPFILETVSNED